MTGEPIVKSTIQLVFDTNILVDALASRGDYYRHAVDLLEMVRKGNLEGWYAPHTLTTVYYLLERTLIKDGATRKDAVNAARELIKTLIGILKPLPQIGNEILDLDAGDSDDFEDLLIIKLATDYLSNPLFVTRDKWFLKTQSHNSGHPKEIIELGVDRWNKDSSIYFIDLKAQQRRIRPQLEKNIHNVLIHGRYIMGPEVAELEEKLAGYTDVKHCIGVASGSDALQAALMALGIGYGDEVITTPFSFIATAEIIALLGAVPVFVDVDPRTYNMDPGLIEAAVTEKTKAIMPVSLYGQCADFDRINAIAQKHNLPVIEDGAQSFGATYKGRRSCALSTIGCTSFFPSKPLGGYGDGGACFTNDDDLAKVMREIRVHGQSRRYHHPRIGFNGRLDTLQAAILLAKFDIFHQEVEKRGVIGSRYSSMIQEQCPEIVTPFIEEWNSSVYAQYTIQVKDRVAVQSVLKEKGVPTAVHYPIPLHRQPVFADQKVSLPISEGLSERVLSLPMHPLLDVDSQQLIVNKLGNMLHITLGLTQATI